MVSDLAETPNKSAAFNYTIDFGQGESVTSFEVTSAIATGTNVIRVTFPEAVRGGAVANSATDVSNYTLAGKPLPTGTTITLDSEQKVATITLPATDSVSKDDDFAVFTASNIKNTAGTKTSKTFTDTVEVKDNTAPVLRSAKALDNKTLELTYSEAIDLGGTDVGLDFSILEGSTAVTLAADELKAAPVSGFPTKIRLTIDSTTTLDLAKNITIETKASTLIKDVSDAGNTQKAGIKVTVQKP
ncbi:hypothetical protein [Alkalihalophilus marmarensis]|uniref:hypothetical protein n=1 Tax=Alkalihalophilus marmarensis TaxID=521377 RepID=UPI002DB7B8AE|nr:hypothetical protein [Alkalihalophilus marmarensis]MEC2074242.1 hypothetical protein [Alkalihalophilus marmarensis]